jgi:flagellar protein FliO/FliZ
MLFWLFILVLLAAATLAGLWGYRAYMTGDSSFNLGGWFAPKPEPRLGVTEQAAVDSRRKLVLVRRDDVEHLIMTGGPVDVLIETNISAPKAQIAKASAEPSPPVFTRQPRNFGQAVNE